MQCETLGRRSLPVSVFIYKLKRKNKKQKQKNPRKVPLTLFSEHGAPTSTVQKI